VIGNHPDDHQPIEIYEGPYGKYIKHDKTNAGVPEGETVEGISLETALSLLAAKGGAVKKKTTAKKAATTKKTTTKKTTAAKKTTTKKTTTTS
jgi:DNA topoisomerase I